jgi:hypothetical protein
MGFTSPVFQGVSGYSRRKEAGKNAASATDKKTTDYNISK